MNLLTTRISLNICLSVTAPLIALEVVETRPSLAAGSIPLVVQLTVIPAASNAPVAAYNAIKFLPVFGIDKHYTLISLAKCLLNIY
jgi:hypothetical protein